MDCTWGQSIGPMRQSSLHRLESLYHLLRLELLSPPNNAHLLASLLIFWVPSGLVATRPKLAPETQARNANITAVIKTTHPNSSHNDFCNSLSNTLYITGNLRFYCVSAKVAAEHNHQKNKK
jgi:hypothetical protein